jgi:outer membrane protein insertion porin family
MPLTLPRLIASGLALAALALVAGDGGRRVLAQETLPTPPDRYGLQHYPPAGAPAAESVPAPTPDGAAADIVTEVRIVGNDTVAANKVAAQLTTRAGRPFDRAVVMRDIRKLEGLGWFLQVKPLYEATPQGRIVIFQVVERPTIRYVSYIGNESIRDKTLGKQTLLKAGGAIDPYSVEEGRRKIKDYYVGKGYNNVQVTILEGNKATDHGVVYLIHEGGAQKVWDVDFVGNDFVSAARLKTIVKSKPPILMLWKGYVDREKIDADKDLLTAYYRAFGFFQAKISPHYEFNEKGNWLTITWVISEGLRYEVRDIRYLGNTKFEPGAMAATGKVSGGAPFEQAKMQEETQRLQDLYGSQGFVFAKIEPETVFLEEPGQVDLVYKIEEGQKWRVGRVFVHIGGDNPHTRIQTALNRVTIFPGQVMDIRELHASERRLAASSVFDVNPANGTKPKITFRIPEDVDLDFAERPTGNVRGQSPEYVGPPVIAPPSFQGEQPPTGKFASVTPEGAYLPIIDTNVHVYCDDYDHYLRWVEAEKATMAEQEHVADQPAAMAPAEGVQPASAIEVVPGYEALPPAPPATDGQHGAVSCETVVIRGQSPEPESTGNWLPAWQATRPATPVAGNPYAQIRGQSPGDGSAYAGVGGAAPQSGYVNQAYATVPAAQPGQAAPAQYGGQVVQATGPETAPVAGYGVQPAQYSPQLQPPAGSVYPTPLNTQGPLPGYSVDPTSPYYVLPPGAVPAYEEGMVDVFINGDETQTGRLMLGVGVNSDAGVVGNMVVDERNFNWRRYPTSFEDVRNGTAFRGNGERFRIDASPGSSVNRYLVSFQDPYWFDQPVSLGLSGSYFDRRFRDWDEQRVGGRVALGYQWTDRDLSATVAYRGESIKIFDPSVPAGTVPELDEALGENALHGFKLTLIRDTRDNPFLATQGTYFEVGAEQVIGTFDYPRIDLDARKYWLLHERPDHSGRHVLSYGATVGYSGTHTPIYEHYFAGGFATLRGFDFRGASPIDNNVQVGGEFQWLNSLQYLFPITADEMLHGVVFCDFGTVERNVTIKDFRVAPGAGLRITVPAMGPAPIALDFAWAVNHADFDDRQVFSFSLGFTR